MVWKISEESLYGVGDYVYTVDTIKDKGIDDFDIDYSYIEYHYKNLSDNVMVVLSNELDKFEILLDKGTGVYLSLGVMPFTDNYQKEFDFYVIDDSVSKEELTKKEELAQKAILAQKTYDELLEKYGDRMMYDEHLEIEVPFRSIIDNIIDNSYEFHNSYNLDYDSFTLKVCESIHTWLDIYDYEFIE